MERDSFVFYRSFEECISELDPECQIECYKAIVRYALDGIEPEANGVVMAMFRAIKPQIDANNKRFVDGKKGAEYGKLGGRPKKDKNPIGVIDKNPIGVTSKTPNVNVNVNENVNVYIHIRDMYNETCVSYPKVTTLSEKRKKALSARLKVYSVDDFKRLFTKAEESDFLKGSNKSNWSATFDWLICDANMAKVLDGNYDNKKIVTAKKIDPGFTQRDYDMDALEKRLLAN